jgi:hypothetical protein
MAKPERPRYLPPHGRRSRFATPPPRWFVREAAEAFDLSPFAIAAMTVIADNLDEDGASRTSITLLAKRANMSRNAAQAAVDALIAARVLFELDPRHPGRMMRYAIAKEMP